MDRLLLRFQAAVDRAAGLEIWPALPVPKNLLEKHIPGAFAPALKIVAMVKHEVVPFPVGEDFTVVTRAREACTLRTGENHGSVSVCHPAAVLCEELPLKGPAPSNLDGI